MVRFDPLLFLNPIAQAIFDKKGVNILALDLKSISTLTHYVIIAEGSVDKHVIAIAHNVIAVVEQWGLKPYSTEGMKSGDWIVLDYLDVIVHLFIPSMREKYQLEELWRAGKIFPLQIAVNGVR